MQAAIVEVLLKADTVECDVNVDWCSGGIMKGCHDGMRY